MKHFIAVFVCLVMITVMFAVLPSMSIGSVPPEEELVAKYDTTGKNFKKHEIGDRIVYFHQRTIGDAIIENDYILYQFNKQSKKLIKHRQNWRHNLPEQLPVLDVTREQAEQLVGENVQFSELLILDPASDIYNVLAPVPENPVWVVVHIVDNEEVRTVIDATNGEKLGSGITPPYNAFSLTGPCYGSPCRGGWISWYTNAADWFDLMGYDTDRVLWPSEDMVRNHVQSTETALFYELAHGGSYSFASGCHDNGDYYESTTATEIRDWITDYPKIPFTFVGSCGGLCSEAPNTLSYEFRKGSSDDTATVGYCGMATAHCSRCWSVSLRWQDVLFDYLSQGLTAQEAFDMAHADYPQCSADPSCMRLHGDGDLRIFPPLNRMTDLQVTLSPKTQSVDPGMTAIYTVMITNSSDTTDVFNLSVEGQPVSGWSNLDQNSLFIDAGGTAETTVEVTPPSTWFEFGQHDYLFKVRATADTAAHVSDTGTASISVTPLYSVRVEMTPYTAQAGPGDVQTFTVTVTNSGLTMDTFFLNVSGDPVADWATLSQDKVNRLNPGESASVTVEVEVPSDYFTVDDKIFKFDVTAVSKKYAEVSDTTASTLTVLAPYKVNVDVTPASTEIEPSGSACYSVTITNTGLREDTYSLSLETTSGTTNIGNWCTFSQTEVSLAPWQFNVVTLTIQSPYPADYAQMMNEYNRFVVVAESSTHPGVVEGRDDATVIFSSTKYSRMLFVSNQVAELTAFTQDPSPHPDIDPGVKNSLLSSLDSASAKINDALAYLIVGDETNADNKLNAAQNDINAFVNAVQAQTSPPEWITLGTLGETNGPYWFYELFPQDLVPPLIQEPPMIIWGHWFRLTALASFGTGDPVMPEIRAFNTEAYVRIKGTPLEYSLHPGLLKYGPYNYQVFYSGMIYLPWNLAGEYTFETTLRSLDGIKLASTDMSLDVTDYTRDEVWVNQTVGGGQHIAITVGQMMEEQGEDIHGNISIILQEYQFWIK